jgi:hypothetical protein
MEAMRQEGYCLPDWADGSDLGDARVALAPAPKPEPVCEWRLDEDTDSYDTSCGEKWCFIDGDLRQNRVKFCAYCGRRVESKP